jgi:hypothetical protein
MTVNSAALNLVADENCYNEELPELGQEIKGRIFQIVPPNDPFDFFDSASHVLVSEIHQSGLGYLIQDKAFKIVYGAFVIYMSKLTIKLDDGEEIEFGHVVMYKDTLVLVPIQNIDTTTPYWGGW